MIVNPNRMNYSSFTMAKGKTCGGQLNNLLWSHLIARSLLLNNEGNMVHCSLLCTERLVRCIHRLCLYFNKVMLLN